MDGVASDGIAVTPPPHHMTNLEVEALEEGRVLADARGQAERRRDHVEHDVRQRGRRHLHEHAPSLLIDAGGDLLGHVLREAAEVVHARLHPRIAVVLPHEPAVREGLGVGGWG